MPTTQLCAQWRSCVIVSVARQLAEGEGQDIERRTDKAIPGFHIEQPWHC